MKQICLLYNFAQHYRSEIFQLLDQNYDCDFYFGDKYLDVKKMDYSLLKGKVTEVKNKRLGRLEFQRGVLSLPFKYNTILTIGSVHNITTWLILIICKLLPKKKIYLWGHGWYGKESKGQKLLKKIMHRLPDGIFVYGNYSREIMRKEGINTDRVYVVHNSLAYSKQIAIRSKLHPIDVYAQHFENNNPNIVFIGRLTKVKKLDMILNAIYLCKDKHGIDFNLTLIGGGETKESLVTLTNKLMLEKNVWFYGPCYAEEEIGEMVYNADLCVSPGNVGLTAMHTLVFGTPVITHDNFPKQMPEFEAIKDGETGAFFHYDNIESLAECMSNWYKNHKNERDIIRQNCMAEIDNYWTPQFQLDVFKSHLK